MFHCYVDAKHGLVYLKVKFRVIITKGLGSHIETRETLKYYKGEMILIYHFVSFHWPIDSYLY